MVIKNLYDFNVNPAGQYDGGMQSKNETEHEMNANLQEKLERLRNHGTRYEAYFNYARWLKKAFWLLRREIIFFFDSDGREKI